VKSPVDALGFLQHGGVDPIGGGGAHRLQRGGLLGDQRIRRGGDEMGKRRLLDQLAQAERVAHQPDIELRDLQAALRNDMQQAFGFQARDHLADGTQAKPGDLRPERGLAGQAKKLVVLDLDDTLWGGIVGDVGWQGLRLGGHDALGEAYVDFQRHLKALARIARSRVPATRGAIPTGAGLPAPEFLADRELTADLVRRSVPPRSLEVLRTARSPEYLQWRYGPADLHSRRVPAPGGPDRGVGIFHLRRRGAATEAVVCELLVPSDDADTSAAILRAEGFSLALQRIYETASTVDQKTMALQYLEAFKALGASPSTKYILPLELTDLAKHVGGFLDRGLEAGGDVRRREDAEPPAA